jgi:putative flippase GtrA
MTQSTNLAPPEIHPAHPPVVPIPQDPFIPTGRLRRLVNLFPRGQFVRYLCVGVFNTIFGFGTYAVLFTLFSPAVPSRYASLIAPLASIVSTPLNITVAYFGYKFFVFRTKGNYLPEWLKCFAVYGTGMIPGLLVLSALTRLLQSLIHSHAATLHTSLYAVETHLSGKPLAFVHHIAVGSAMAGYIAGALVTGFSTIFSFVGHKKVTFASKPAVAPTA